MIADVEAHLNTKVSYNNDLDLAPRVLGANFRVITGARLFRSARGFSLRSPAGLFKERHGGREERLRVSKYVQYSTP
jgi:hypothetical protein